jgi:glycine cleavage system aminomethyltransferase T
MPAIPSSSGTTLGHGVTGRLEPAEHTTPDALRVHGILAAGATPARAGSGMAAPAESLVPFVLTGPGIPRQGNLVRTGGGPQGVVTSGTLSPCLDVGIGMAYVPVSAANPGTSIEIDVRGKLRSAEVREKPLYRREG